MMSWQYPQIIQKVKTNGFLRNVLLLAGGKVASQFLYVITLPIISRLYSASDFGALATYQAILALLILICALKYECAILLPEEDEMAANVVVVALGALCLVTAVIAISLWLLAQSRLFNGSFMVLQQYWWFLPIAQLGGGFYLVHSYWLMRKKRFKPLATTGVMQILGQVITQIAMGLSHFGTFGLLVGDVVGRSGGGLTLARLAWRDLGGHLRRFDIKKVLTMMRRYQNLSLVSSGSSLIYPASTQGPLLILAFMYGAHPAGWFALLTRVASSPHQLIGKSLSQVFMSDVAMLAREKPQELRQRFLKMTGVLTMIGCVMALVFAVCGPWLFATFFGAEWQETGIYARFLALMFLTETVALPLMPLLSLLEKQSWQFGWDVSRTLLVVVGLILVARAGFSPRFAILYYGVVMTLMNIFLVFLCLVAIERLIPQMSESNVQPGVTL
jgi:O-antigen/teichoic acid export membrane protein